MVLEKIFGKLKPQKNEELSSGNDDVEIDPSALGGEQKVNVRIETLKDFNDTDRVQGVLREGSVVFLRIRDLREKNVAELKRSIEKLKKTCVANNGDIAGVEDDYLVLCPNFARIYRGKVAV